jgi:predicted phosphate transport protein (TIGR00153 family)
MSIIGSLFGRSPIKPMQQHMKVAVSCAREIVPFVEAMASGDLEAMSRQRERIDELEHAADEIKHEIRAHLPKRLFMPVERRDMLEILDRQDSIADVAQDIAELAEIRGMVAPEPLREPLLELTRRVIVTCEQSEKIIDELDELIETGFGPHEVAKVETMIDELNGLESETDALAEKCTRVLFAIEDDLGIGAWFWYQLISWIADMADYAEKVGNRLRLLIAS